MISMLPKTPFITSTPLQKIFAVILRTSNILTIIAFLLISHVDIISYYQVGYRSWLLCRLDDGRIASDFTASMVIPDSRFFVIIEQGSSVSAYVPVASRPACEKPACCQDRDAPLPYLRWDLFAFRFL